MGSFFSEVTDFAKMEDGATLEIAVPQKRSSRVSMCMQAPVLIHNAIPSSKFDEPYSYERCEGLSTFQKMFTCANGNYAGTEIKFRKDHKKDAICICITGDLPGMKETGYMEVLDDGKEPEGPHPVGKKIRSIQKHRDYDFTLIESVVVKKGKRMMTRKLRFQFSDDVSNLRVECKNLTSKLFTAPIILYFRHH